MLKKATLAALTLMIASAASAVNPKDVVKQQPKDRDVVKGGQANGQGGMAAANKRGQIEAYVNTIYTKIQDRRLADVLQEVVIRSEKVENDAAALKGVERFVELIKKNESPGRTLDEAVALALIELRPDLKLKIEDFIEACK